MLSASVKKLVPGLMAAVLASSPACAQNQADIATRGVLVVIPAYGEVTHANDEGHATFQVEEQDRDKTAAASRANLKMKQGLEILKREDPGAMLKTRGYYTYPVYDNSVSLSAGKPRPVVGWRVGQYVDLTTGNLDGLPKTVAAAQKILSLNGLQFGLAPATVRKLDRERIDAAYHDLTERIGAIAHAMGRSSADAILDTVDFEGSGNYVQKQPMAAPAAMSFRANAPDVSVEEPSFEPGETTLQMGLVGKVKFK
ncbi:MAG: SIMPL domain-containing protein [Burkholderiaceae bacterium]|nr:SIMPL domain-containing protein [Burkholderiaceae bacterium]